MSLQCCSCLFSLSLIGKMELSSDHVRINQLLCVWHFNIMIYFCAGHKWGDGGLIPFVGLISISVLEPLTKVSVSLLSISYTSLVTQVCKAQYNCQPLLIFIIYLKITFIRKEKISCIFPLLINYKWLQISK